MGRKRTPLDLNDLSRQKDDRWLGAPTKKPPSPEVLARLFDVITLTERGATWPVDWGGKHKQDPSSGWYQTADGTELHDASFDTIRGKMVKEWVEKKRSPRA